MAGKRVSLDLHGKVEHQASLPGRPEDGEQLESMGLGRPEQSSALRSPIAWWTLTSFTVGRAGATAAAAAMVVSVCVIDG